MTKPAVRRLAWTLWITCLVMVLASCASKNTSPVVDSVSDPSSLIMTEDAEPLDPELSAEPVEEGQLTSHERSILSSQNGIFFDLDMHNTKEVEHFFSYFTHKARGTFEKWLKRSEQHLPMVRAVFTKYGLPQDLILLAFAESGYNVKAYSWAGAGGLWQFMPYTGRKYGLRVDWWIDERRDPYMATDAAARYLKDLYGIFGDWHLALAAYNAGEGKIMRALAGTGATSFFDLAAKNNRLKSRARLKRETLQYVPKFIAISKIFQNLETLGFEPVRWTEDPALEHVTVPGGTDLLALAQAGGMKWSEFHALNPAYRRQVSPPKMTTTAHLPKEKVTAMVAYLNDPGTKPYAGYQVHKVRSGDSWWGISRRYGVPIAVLKKVNNRSKNTLQPGQRLMIPGHGKEYEVAAAEAAEKQTKRSKKSSASTTNSSTAKTRKVAQSRSNYVVQSGDTLWSISRRYNVSVGTLRDSNGLNSKSKIKIGQRIYIPDASGSEQRAAKAVAANVHSEVVSYKVRRGDTLYAIAKKFGVSVGDLRSWNNLNTKSTIYARQVLKIYVP
ncbi:MAG: LysM peptidoglycan-binding domain-containing protein [Desulfovibrionaceae bacterium]